MAIIVIERASGAVVELELKPGAEVPRVDRGDRVRLVLSEDERIRAIAEGSDLAIATLGPTGALEAVYIFEGLARHLDGDPDALTVVDARTGTETVLDPADTGTDLATLLSEIETAAGQPPAAGPQSSPRFNSTPDFETADSQATGGADTDLTVSQRADLQGAGLAGGAGPGTPPFPGATNLALLTQSSAIDTSNPTAGSIAVTVAAATSGGPISGNAIDGYIVGATVFADTDGDGVLDAGEAWTVTGADGLFTLAGGSGALVLTGGVDVSTGQAFKGMLTAPAGSSVVSPLTTLIQTLVESGQSAAAAQQQVRTAFGLSDAIDLTGFDPIAGVLAGTAGAGAVMSAAIKVQNSIVQAASVVDGAAGSGTGFGTVTAAVYEALADRIAGTPGSYDLDDAAGIAALINGAAGDSALGLDANSIAQIAGAASDAATVIAASNAEISALGSAGTALLTALAQVAYVAQNAGAQALYDALEAVHGSGSLADLTTAIANYTGANLTAAINTADIGDVDGAVVGTSANETLTGTSGADVIDGGAGADTLHGLAGDDRLIGGLGDDILIGGAGNDSLTGGSGNDVFRIAPGEEGDTVEDFAAGDRVDLTAFVTAGRTLALVQSGSDTQIRDGGTTIATVKGAAPADLWVAPSGTVTANTAPVAVTAAIVGADEDSTATGQLVATDTDAGTTLAYALVTAPAEGTLTIAADGSYSFVPGSTLQSLGAGESRQLSFTYSVSDGKVTVNKTATLTVDGRNDAPVAVTTAAATDEDTALTGQLSATDADANDTAAFSLVSGPAKGTLDLSANGVFTFDPGSDFVDLAEGQSEAVTFVYRVTDGQGASATQTVTITVDGTNDTPVVGTVAVSTDEDTTLTGTLADHVSDPDGDTLTFALVGGTAQGTLTLAADGNYSFAPGAAFQGLDDGEASVQSFTYTVSDGTTTVQRTGTITVTGANDAPVGITATIAAFEDSSVSGTLAASDVDIEALTFALGTAPAKGTLTIAADGGYSFDPSGAFDSLALGQSEDVTFTYTVSDGTATTTRSATITVTGSNDAPVASAATVTRVAAEDGASTGTLPGSDVDSGDTLTFAIVGQPATGTISITDPATGAYSFDPGTAFQGLNAGESVELSFVYSVTDSQGASAQKTATMTVVGANDAPTAFHLNANHADGDPADDDTIEVDRVTQAGTVVGRVQAIADVDAGDTHTFALVDDAEDRFTLNATTGEIRVAPNATFDDDEYTITVEVADASGATVEKTFTVEVNNVVNGNSADGYIQDATVFADTDGDGELDDGEVSATTNVEGNFRLEDGTGNLILLGGTDVSTDLAFEGVLLAPEGSSVITPLTSIIATMVGNGASDAADAQAKMASALGIATPLASALADSGATSLLHFDPVKQSVAGAEGAIEVMAAGIRVQNSIDIIASALVGATRSENAGETDTDGDDVATVPAMQAAFTAMAGFLATASFPVLTDAASVEAILDAAAIEAGLSAEKQTLIADAASDVAAIIAASNEKVNAILADAGSPIDAESVLTQLAQVSVVAQGEAGQAIEDALSGGTAIGTDSYTGDALDTAVAGASVGDVDGNDAPIVTSGLAVAASEDGTLNGVLTATDEEGDPLTFSLDSPAKKGTVVVNADGTFAYTPNAAQQALAEGQTATDTFRFTVSDGLLSVTQTVTVTIQGANDAPIALTAAIAGANEDRTLSGALSASDVDTGATLTYALDTPPAKGTLSIAADGRYTFDPGTAFQSLDDGESEAVAFTYVVTDDRGASSAPKTVTITVTGRNDAPVALAEAATTGESASVSGQLDATDIDGDALTFALLSGTPLGTITVAADGGYTFDPGNDFASLAAGASQQVEFTYTVSDGTVTVTQKGVVTVTGADSAPVAVTSGFAANEDTAVTGQLAATDADSASLSYSLIAAPSKGTLTIGTDGAYTFTPGIAFQSLAAGQSEAVTFTYGVSDGTTTTTRSATITVAGANDAPVAVTVAVAALEDTPVSGQLVATDVDADATLTYALVAGPAKGALTIGTGGAYTFDPAGAFESLAAGQSEAVTFTYSVSDGTATVQQQATITVAGANDAPAAVTVSVAATEDTAVTGQLAATDADAGAVLTFGLIAPPAKGTLALAANGTYTFTPGNAFQGLDTGESEQVTFTYSVSDGTVTVQQQATITVTGANDAPVAVTAALTTVESSLLAGQLAATDVDGDALTFAKVVSPAKGTLTIDAGGGFVFDPGTAFQSLGAGQSEAVTFTYSVSDGTASVLKQVTLTVTGASDGPVAVTAAVAAGEDAPVTGQLVATDPDTPASGLSYALVSAPAKGSLVIATDGSYSFDPNGAFESLGADQSEAVTFIYSVSDGTTTVQKQATITVTGANDAPVAVTVALAAAEDVPLAGQLAATDADAGATLAYALVAGPEKGTVTIGSDGAYTFDPDGAFESLNIGETEDVTFTYSVSDGTATIQQQVTVTVAGANDAPDGEEDTGLVFRAEVLSVGAAAGVLANDGDPDASDSPTVTAFDATSALGATVVVNADGSYTYDPTEVPDFATLGEGETATDSFTYTVSDGNGGTAVATVTITVSGSLSDSAAAVLGDDGILRVDADALALAEIDVSGFDADVVFTSLGSLTRIVTAPDQALSIDAAQIGAISDAHEILTIAGGAAVDITGAGLTPPDGATPASVANLLGLEFEGLSDAKSLIPDNLTVDGSRTDTFAAFWVQLDRLYVGSGDYYDLDVNTSFAHLGNDYAAYLAAGGAALTDIYKVTVDGAGQALRLQSLHDNLLGNLGDGPIASRFGEADPRTEAGAEFGTRPYHEGAVGPDGLYSNIAKASAAIGWDLAHGVAYPDALPAPYAVFDAANTLAGGTGTDWFYGGGGDDTISGGTGDDTAAYMGDRADFALSYDDATGRWIVSDGDDTDGAEGADSLSGIETIVFADGSTLAFDAELANGFNIGSGNASTGFVIDANTERGIEIGLKAKEAYRGDDLSPEMGTYHALAGAGHQSAAAGDIDPLRATWNIEYSIDLTGSGLTLGDLDVLLSLDTAPAAGAPGSVFVLDLNAIPGLDDTQQQAVSGLTVLQDSQNPGFDFWDTFFSSFGFDPRLPGEYQVTLSVRDPDSGALIGESVIAVEVRPGAVVDSARNSADDGESDSDGVARFASLQSALDAAAAGGVIVLVDDDAAATLTLDKPLTVLIANADGGYDHAGIVYADDGSLQIDMAALSAQTVDLSGLDTGISLAVSGLGAGTTLVIDAAQASGLTLSGEGTVVVTGTVADGDFSGIAADLDLTGATLAGTPVMPDIGAGRTLSLTAGQVDGAAIELDPAATLHVEVVFDPLSADHQALPGIDIAGVTVGGSNSPEAVWNAVTVSGSIADKFKLFWVSADQNYYENWPANDTDANTAFVELGNIYVAYLAAGGAPILDIVQTKVSGSPNFASRQQSLHDNLLGNLGDGPIASRFTNDGLADPRSTAAAEYGDRPFHTGTVGAGGTYSGIAAVSAVIAWDLAHGIDYTDSLPAVYDVLGGDDTLSGNGNANWFWGGHGNDAIAGAGGIDTLFGGAGDDTLTGGTGADLLDGGDGTDTASYAGSAQGVTVDLGAGTASGGDAAGDTLAGIENLTGSSQADSLAGDDGANTIAGGAGNDALSGGAGNDILDGGTGDDTLIGGVGDDTLIGGTGTDTAVFTGNRAEYDLSLDSEGRIVVADSVGGRDGTDTASGVEALSFADGAIAVLVVDPSGTNGAYTTIQAAIDAAPDGATILVQAGAYALSSTIIVDKPVTLLGAQAGTDPRSAAGLRTAGDGSESIVDGGGTLSTLIRIEADGVTIDGFDIRNGTGDLITSPSSGSIANPVIRYNFVHDAIGDEGMQIRNATDPLVEYNNVYATVGDGINLAGSTSDGIVRFNEVHDTSTVNAAIYLDGAENTTVQGNQIYNVTGNDGIKFGDKGGSNRNDSGGTAIDNVIHDTAQDGISVYMSNVTVTGNEIYNSTSENGAIFVEFAVNGVTIANNDIHDNGTEGDGRTTYAIRIGKDDSPADVEVTGNTLTGNEAQFFLEAGATLADGAGVEDVLAANLFDAAASWIGGNVIYSSLAEAQAAAPDGVTMLVANGALGVLKYGAQLAHAVAENDGGGTDGFHPGTGNSDVAFAIADNPSAGIEAALKAKLRHSGDLAPDAGTGTYYAETGFSSGTAALWNFDYSVVSYSGTALSAFTIAITADFTALDGTTTAGIMSFDPIAHRDDTGETYYHDPSGTTEGVQNSQNIAWNAPDFDAGASGTYTLRLAVTDADGGVIAETVVSVRTADIIVANAGDADADIDHNTLTAALADAEDGDVVLVKDGFTSSETTLTLDKAITLMLAGGTLAADAPVHIGSDGTAIVDMDRLPASLTTLDVSGLGLDVRVTGLGGLTRIVTAPDQALALDGAQIGALSNAHEVLTIAGGGAVDVVGAALVLPDGETSASVANLLGLEFEGLADAKSLIPGNLTVDGNHTDAFAAFWIQLDQLYVGSGDYYDLPINTSFAYLGNDYAAYLQAGGEALLDLVKVPDGRAQTLHDNLLGNLGDGPIASRFGEADPRTEAGSDFGTRPYHEGALDGGGLYANADKASATLGWDLANGVAYPDALPAPYAVLNGANALTGGSGTDWFHGGGGDDTITGGSGIDTAGYRGDLSGYRFADNGSGGFTVTDVEAGNGDDGTDTLAGIETLVFGDARVLVVGAGSQYATIQAAIDAASAGDTILVADGTYDRITIDKPLTLLSMNGPDGATIIGSSVSQGWGIRVAAGIEGVVIGGDGHGFTVNAGASDLAAVYLAEGAGSVTVEGNTLDGGTHHAFLTTGSAHDVTVTGNTLTADGPHAVAYVNGEASLGSTRASDNVDFTGNTITGGTNAGLLLGIEAANSDVSGNTFDGVAGYAQLELWGDGTTVAGNGFVADGDTVVLDSAGSHDEAAILAANSFAGGVFIEGEDTIYASIQDAIDAASDGDTIRVSAGTYAPFAIGFGGPVNLSILAAAGAVIDAGDDSTAPARIVDLRADGTLLDGFTILGPGGLAEAGVHVGISISGQGVTVRNNDLSNMLTGIQTTSQHEAGNAVIAGNTVEAEYGISLQNTGNTVDGNTVTAVEEGLSVTPGANSAGANTITVEPGGEAFALYLGADAATVATDGNTVTVGDGASLQNAADLAGTGGTLVVGAGDYGGETVTVRAEGLSIDAEAGATGFDIALDSAVADITLTGEADLTVSGNALDNRLEGGDGDDILLGGDGDDVLIGGSGENTLTGGGGNDVFTLANDGTAIIEDFGTGDTLDFGDILTGAPDSVPTFQDGAGGAEVYSSTAGVSPIAILANTAAASLTVDPDGNVVLSA